MITINALKVRTKLGGILDNVSKKGEHYIIERMGKPMAMIAPYQEFDIERQKEERHKRLKKAAKAIDRWREKYGKKYRGEDSAIIVRRMRDERTKHLLDVVEGRQ